MWFTMDISLAYYYVVPAAFILWFIFFRRASIKNKHIIRKRDVYDDVSYEEKVIDTPLLRGTMLRIATSLLNSWLGKLVFANIIVSQADLDLFRKRTLGEEQIYLPIVPCTHIDRETDSSDIESTTKSRVSKLITSELDKIKGNTADCFVFNSIQMVVSKYKSKETTPSEVAEASLTALEEMNDDLNAIIRYDKESIRKMAADSTKRYAAEAPLSPIDGVIVAVKDEIPVRGFPCTCGTTFMNVEKSCMVDCSIVARLRSLGAIILGVANMHEIGLGTTGINPNKGFGACRNPYDLNRITGGSSSGCAAAVASGLCTFALGTDGGGSVRIPAAMCGLVGLKATFGRFTMAGMHTKESSMSNVGPLCATTKDAALVYALIAGPDEGYPNGMQQPPLQLPIFSGHLNSLKIVYDERLFKDCNLDVREACKAALGHLEELGAHVRPFEIAEYQDNTIAQRIVILSEMCNDVEQFGETARTKLSLPSQLLLDVARTHVRALDFIQANQQRARAIAYLKQLFESGNVDAIVTPATACCATVIDPQDLHQGVVNGEEAAQIMRFTPLANFTGVPAISIPVGYNAAGLSVGLQIMTAWWREELLLEIADAVERRVQRNRPDVFRDILS